MHAHGAKKNDNRDVGGGGDDDTSIHREEAYR